MVLLRLLNPLKIECPRAIVRARLCFAYYRLCVMVVPHIVHM